MCESISRQGDLGVQHPRRFPIFRPHWHERPAELLERAFSSETELDWIRIAKHGNTVVSAYEIEQHDSWNFSLKSLVVSPEYQNQGLGSWMLLHAVGVIESKGGRFVHASCGGKQSIFSRAGFTEVSPNTYVMQLQPE